MTQPVVVGFDDTEHSTFAVTCAVREARVRNAPLRLLHAYQWVPPVTYGLSPGIAAEQAVSDASKDMLSRAAGRLRAENPGLAVETTSVRGDAAGALAHESRTASLVVVGGRGRGGFVGQLLGSVALRVLSDATCPVMVARGTETSTTGRIMVGIDVDHPAGSADLLEFAFAEAAMRKAEVYAVHIWDDPTPLYVAGGQFTDEIIEAIRANRLKLLDAALEPWERKYPNVAVTRQSFPGTPGRLLVASTGLVDTLVIGGLARAEGHPGMRIGALAHTILHHAQCPVVIVPEA